MWILVVWSLVVGSAAVPSGFIVFEAESDCNKFRESVYNNRLDLPLSITDVTCHKLEIDMSTPSSYRNQ